MKTKHTPVAEDAWDEGAAAHGRQHDRSENPYPRGTRQHNRWLAGWDEMNEASFGGYRDDE